MGAPATPEMDIQPGTDATTPAPATAVPDVAPVPAAETTAEANS